MNQGIPMVQEKANRDLRDIAETQGWDGHEYHAEASVLEHGYGVWAPTFAAYSITILLYSIFETQLHSFAEYMGKKAKSNLQVKDIAGKGVTQTETYLNRVLSVSVKQDAVWSRLEDLRKLRNIIVHRGGRPGESSDQKAEVKRLLSTYQPELELSRGDGFHEQIWISMQMCRGFAQDVDGFFERVFKTNGLPDRFGQLDS